MATGPKIGILVVAYNAETTLTSVLKRIPPGDLGQDSRGLRL